MTTEDRGVEEVTQHLDPDVHLQRLLEPKLEEPWFKATIQNFKDYFNPPKLPPLELTSKPVDVQDIWKSYNPGPKRAGTISIISTISIHVLAILLLFVIFRATPAGKKILEYTHLYVDLKPYDLPPKKEIAGGGGGGGNKAPIPPVKERLLNLLRNSSRPRLWPSRCRNCPCLPPSRLKHPNWMLLNMAIRLLRTSSVHSGKGSMGWVMAPEAALAVATAMAMAAAPAGEWVAASTKSVGAFPLPSF